MFELYSQLAKYNMIWFGYDHIWHTLYIVELSIKTRERERERERESERERERERERGMIYNI